MIDPSDPTAVHPSSEAVAPEDGSLTVAALPKGLSDPVWELPGQLRPSPADAGAGARTPKSFASFLSTCVYGLCCSPR